MVRVKGLTGHEIRPPFQNVTGKTYLPQNGTRGAGSGVGVCAMAGGEVFQLKINKAASTRVDFLRSKKMLTHKFQLLIMKFPVLVVKL